VKLGLVALQCQHVVAPALHNLRGNVLLASRGVDRDDSVLHVDNVQQFWDRGNLVGFLLGRHLPQGDAVVRGPGAHEVHRS